MIGVSSGGGGCVCVGLVNTPEPLYALWAAPPGPCRGSGKALLDGMLVLTGSSPWLDATNLEIAIELGARPAPNGCLGTSWPLSRHQSPPPALAGKDAGVLAGLVPDVAEGLKGCIGRRAGAVL